MCKLIIPGVGAVREVEGALPNCYSFRTQSRTNGTIAIDLIPNSTASSALLTEGVPTLTAQDAVSLFERRAKQRFGLRGVRYCIDIPARTEAERSRIGLPIISPIWPLMGNKLAQTRARVRGLHDPYAYRAYGSLGAIFGMHIEDCETFSINYLYKGSKIWVIVPPSSAALLEKKFRENSAAAQLNKCSQFIREHASYLTLEVLDRWGISYKIIQQNAGEAMLTFPRAYHQGFSVADSFAEAVNYADNAWNTVSYSYCNPRSCPPGCISQDLMSLRESNEEQFSADEEEKKDEEANRGGLESAGLLHHSKYGSTRQQSGKHGLETVKRKAAMELSVPYKKNRRNSIGNRPNKSTALKEINQKDISTVLQEVISKSTIQVDTILQKITDRLEEYNVEYDDTRTLTLVRLFYAIASPDAICQLRDACRAIRQGTFQITEPTDDILSTIKALDRLDANSHIISIAKRFHLVRLSAKRFALQAGFLESSKDRTIQETSDEIFKREDSIAVTELMREAYPHLKPTRFCKTKGKDEYLKKRKTLKERLLNGRKWSKLSNAFTSGIFALLPTQGEYHLSNKE